MRFRSLVFGAALTGAIIGQAQPTSAQLTQFMTHIKIRMLEPAPKPGTFAAEPKEYWRSRKAFARVAEGPDNALKIQQLMIVNQPDIWLLELMSKQGKHIVNPGPNYDVHISMFERTLKDLGDLEYGNEVEFFKSHKAKESDGPAINGKPTTKMELSILGYDLALIVDKEKQVPRQFHVTMPPATVKTEQAKTGKQSPAPSPKARQSYTMEYMVYELLKFDPALFKAPSGFKIDEQKVVRPRRTEPVILPVPPASSKGPKTPEPKAK